MDKRDQVSKKLEDLFLHFRSSLVTNPDAEELRYQGVDSCQFDLIGETNQGSMYFRPMSQERLDTLDRRADYEEILFEKESTIPSMNNAEEIQDAINHQLRPFVYAVLYEEDSKKADELGSWEPDDTCGVFERRLREFGSAFYSGSKAPSKQTTWTLLDQFAARHGLPHRSCMVIAQIRDVTGPTRHELMILTGLMGTRMFQKAYRKYTVFPVLMLSIYGSKARVVQAYMSPELLRLQVRYSEFFDFRNLTKKWLDISVRWFLNEPLTVPSLPCELDSPEHPESSDEEDGSLVSASPKSVTGISDSPRNPEQENTPEKPLSQPMWSPGCHAEAANLNQTLVRPSTLWDAL